METLTELFPTVETRFSFDRWIFSGVILGICQDGFEGVKTLKTS